MACKCQNMRKNVAAQMKDEAFNGKNPISIINVLTEFKRVCDWPHVYNSATVWFFRGAMTGLALAAIKVRFSIH